MKSIKSGEKIREEDATFPAMLCFAVPGIAVAIAGNIVTTLYLKREYD